MGVCCSIHLKANKIHSNIQIIKGLSNTDFSCLPSKIYLDIHNHYSFIKILGHGSIGTIREAVRKHHTDSDEKFAIKSMPKKSVSSTCILKSELQILLSSDHPNLIKLFEAYEDSEYIHLVMEHCNGNSLLQALSGIVLTEQQALPIMYQIFSAISYLHKIQFVHRDLKLNNFIITGSDKWTQIKVIDFGLSSKFVDNKKLDFALGTPFYMAPEILNNEYGKECDVWSLGICLFKILSGSFPFCGNGIDEIFKSILYANVKFKHGVWEGVSGGCKDLIKKMLVKDSKNRIWMDGVLEHPVFDALKQINLAKIRLSSVENIFSYEFPDKISRCIMAVIIKHLVSQVPIQITESFQALDLKHSGSVYLQDIILAVQPYYSLEHIEKLKTNLENINNKIKIKLNYSEFIFAAMNSKDLLTEKVLKAVYHHLTNVISN